MLYTILISSCLKYMCHPSTRIGMCEKLTRRTLYGQLQASLYAQLRLNPRTSCGIKIIHVLFGLIFIDQLTQILTSCVVRANFVASTPVQSHRVNVMLELRVTYRVCSCIVSYIYIHTWLFTDCSIHYFSVFFRMRMALGVAQHLYA